MIEHRAHRCMSVVFDYGREIESGNVISQVLSAVNFHYQFGIIKFQIVQENS